MKIYDTHSDIFSNLYERNLKNKERILDTMMATRKAKSKIKGNDDNTVTVIIIVAASLVVAAGAAAAVVIILKKRSAEKLGAASDKNVDVADDEKKDT